LKAQICEKIHADYGGGYCCKEKIELKIMTGERNDLAAAPNGNNVSIRAHQVRTCGRRRA
jgi:hypothetical protein